jgi:acyl dehydratase
VTLHASDAAVTAQAKQLAKKRSRKYVAFTAGAATLLAAGGAYAAMLINGEGTASATAYQEQQLEITNGRFSGPLFPGGKIDLVFTVKNPNPFKVKAKTIGLTAGKNPTIACKAGEEVHLSGPLATKATSVTIPAADQTVIDGNGATTTVTIHDAVQLSNNATKGCALTVPFTLTGESVGS